MTTNDLSHSPSEIIQYYLDDQGIGTLPSRSLTWPVHATVLPDTPDNAICVYDTEGKVHGREHVGGETFFHYGIQVRVRSLSHATGWQKARDVLKKFDATLRAEVPIGSETYLIQAISVTTPILPLGLDEADATRRRSFTINALLSVSPRAGTG